jgi:hypothetical protein
MSDESSRRPKPRNDRRPSSGGPRSSTPSDRKPSDRKPSDRKPSDRKPADRKPREGAPGDRKPFDRKPRDTGAGERKLYERRSREAGSGERRPYDRGSAGGRLTSARPPRSDDENPRPRHDDPVIPETVTANQLDKVARAELKTLSKDNADWVARHLVMAGSLIDDDPELAHKHALAAARRAGRVGVVRESVGITAYALGQFDLALRELRTYRRISGRDDQLPLMVDSERGIGRPEKALELGRSVPRATLDVPVQVALAIAMSGARLDLGQPEAALTELQIPQLDPERAFPWSPALFDAYATVLEDLGRTDEAEQWWQRSDRATIALERAAIPEGEDTVEIIDEEWDEDAPH